MFAESFRTTTPETFNTDRAGALDAIRARVESGDADADDILAFLDLWYGSHEKGTAFLTLAGAMSGELFWRVFHRVWTDCDGLPHDAIAELMATHKDAWRVDLMSEEDRSFYAGLPDRILIYRGQDAKDAPRLSWTTDKERAEFFSAGWRGNPTNEDPVVLEGFVPKAHVAAAYVSRNENEVVVFDAFHVDLVEE